MTQNPLSDRTISEIKLLSEIARANNGHVSLQDIATLTSAGLDEAQIRTAWEATPDLQASYYLEQDLLVDKTQGTQEKSFLSEVQSRRARAQQFIQSAIHFLKLCRVRDATFQSVSGSTSYYSTLPGDDLDIFTITNDGVLWVCLFKSMVLARVYRLLHPGFPRICFSYAIDEPFAKKTFATDDLLLARDALNVIVLHGENYYQALLTQNPWMASYFPRLYRLRTEPPREKVEKSVVKSPLSKFLNQFLYFTVGPYLRFKSSQLNRNLRRKGLTGSLFTLRSGPDHFIFESVRYQRLRQMYDRLRKTIRADVSTLSFET